MSTHIADRSPSDSAPFLFCRSALIRWRPVWPRSQETTKNCGRIGATQRPPRCECQSGSGAKRPALDPALDGVRNARRNRGKQFEGADVLALEHSAASQHIASLGLAGAARARTAHQRQPRLAAGFRVHRRPTLRQSRLVHPDNGRSHRRRNCVCGRLRRPLRRYAQAVRQGHDLGHRRQQYADYRRSLEHHAILRLASDSSTIAPAFAPPLTHIESGLGQIVGGAGAYVFWNDMLYADLTFYKGLPVPVLQAFNTGNSTTDALSNVAPYWRVAIEPHWGDLYWETGTFGMYSQDHPGSRLRLRDRQFSRCRFQLANPIFWRSI